MTDNTDHYAAQTPVLTAMLEYGSAIRGDDLKLLLRRMRAASVFVDPPGALTPLLDALEAVLKLHYPETYADYLDYCAECEHLYPCPTAAAIAPALVP